MPKRYIPITFILFWIVPVAWVGLMRTNFPLYPAWIAPLFRVSGVFETAPSRWRIFFIQTKADKNWDYLDDKSLFAPTPLGNRTRFQPLMNEIVDSQPEQASHLLKWIAVHLSHESLSHIKFIRIIHFDISPEMFLICHDYAELYATANQRGLHPLIVASLQLPQVK